MLDREMLYEALHKEIPILTTQIRKLYAELDQKFHLEGAKVPMTFGMDRDCLGSYTQAGGGEREHFHFSLLFVGYSVEHPLSRDDRMDLYKHEYAHYMQAHMKIPEKYQWQTGKHGSAWKYCCSLIGAAPTPYYKEMCIRDSMHTAQLQNAVILTVSGIGRSAKESGKRGRKSVTKQGSVKTRICQIVFSNSC